MNCRIVYSLVIIFFSSILDAHAELYFYPKGRKPTLLIEQALATSHALMRKEGFEDYFIVDVRLTGSATSKRDGSGAWNFTYGSETSEVRIQLSVVFPENYCVLMKTDEVDPRIFERRGDKFVEQKYEHNNKEAEKAGQLPDPFAGEEPESSQKPGK